MTDNTLRVTPEDMGELEKDQIFVFGSNELGLHGAGAALYASKKFGATSGMGFGLSGQSFAIPTKDWNVETLPISVIKFYVDRFVAFARRGMSKPWKFMVTKIGCGLAGLTVEQVAPLFKECRNDKNIWLPQDFHDFLDGKYSSSVNPRPTIDWKNEKIITL